MVLKNFKKVLEGDVTSSFIMQINSKIEHTSFHNDI